MQFKPRKGGVKKKEAPKKRQPSKNNSEAKK